MEEVKRLWTMGMQAFDYTEVLLESMSRRLAEAVDSERPPQSIEKMHFP
jgi:hypothetical protein